MSGSGINWAICKSAHCSREITMPAPHHSVFTGRMPFLPPNQQRQNTDGCCQSTEECTKVILNSTKILRTLNFINIFLFWMIYLCYRELKLISYFNCYVSVCHKNYVWLTHTHTHTHLTALFPGSPGWAGTRKVKPIWILLKQETVSGSGISWAICKSAPRSRQTTTPATHRFFTGRMPFLLPNQQRQSTEGMCVT